MKILKILTFSFLIFLCNQGKSQTLQIDNVQACLGDTASISINMSSIDTVGAITLFIEYDTTMLNFIDLTNINPLASGILFNDMRVGVTGPRLGKVAISWVASGSGVNFSAGIFAVLKFEVLAGNCPLNFSNNCEIVNYSAQIINVNYTNGNLTVPTVPVITTQPSQLSLNTSQNGFYTISATNTDSIQWQINQGSGWVNIQNDTVFQGFNKDTLFVSQPTQTLDGAYFRCILSNLCLSAQSDSVILNVTNVSVSDNKTIHYKISPNPFYDYISIDFPNMTFIEEINIFQVDGKFVKQITEKEQSTHLFITQLNELKKGIYFFEVVSKNKEGVKERKIHKLIKN